MLAWKAGAARLKSTKTWPTRLKRRAAERGVSLDAHVLDLASLEVAELDPADLADLDARAAEWRSTRLGYEVDEIIDWLRDQTVGRPTPLPEPKRF
ncbi:hypothetical protein [Methylopila sp. 73B]|uniref:hypothetical protein n=1 Tax=Methylopila sp. 73B TaxID=1120792 RepID=UPI0004BB20F6|nr:hypothetical protein [Methylopila sp. 73B]